MKSRKVIVKIEHDLEVIVDCQKDIDLGKFISKLQAVKRQAAKQGFKKPRIEFDAGYNNISVDVTAVKLVKPTEKERKVEENRKAKIRIKAQLKREMKEKYEKEIAKP